LFSGFARHCASWRSETIVPTFPIAHSAIPIHATTPKLESGSSAMNANGSEKKTTKSACAWKKTKKFRFAFSPHLRRSSW
jgi:hypothetical protein